MKSRTYPPGVAALIISAGQANARKRELRCLGGGAGQRMVIPANAGSAWSHRRLLALLEHPGLIEWEQRRQEKEDERRARAEEDGNCWRKRYVFDPVLGKPRCYWGPKERRAWAKLTTSQVALWLSGFVSVQARGGDRVSFPARLSLMRKSAEHAADRWDVSRRMLFMALKLRRSGNARLIRAVAEGGVSLGDALAHLEHDADELRKAIGMVERKEARSLRQALA